MKRLLALSAAALLVAGAAFVAAPAAESSPESATWAGDTVHSFVNFKISHLGVSNAYGRFNDFTVSAQGDAAGALTSISFDVNAGSVDTGNANRDKHLKSPDFLNASEFERITFACTGTKANADGSVEASGNLTLHGVTKPLTARVVKVGAGKGMRGEDLVGYETTFTIKRKDFGVGIAKFDPPALGDEVTLTVAAELAKK